MPAHTVLVVDDEEDIRDAVRWTLEDAGYAVLEAPNGREGLDLLRASAEPLVVLLDLMMPGMSGLEVLRILGADPDSGARHAYIIFSAASAFTAPALKSYTHGKRLFALPKPFELDYMIAVVEQAAQRLEGKSASDKDADAAQHTAVVRTSMQTPGDS